MVENFADRAGQLGKWFAEYAEHHKAKAEEIEALPGSAAWAKVERNLERARYAYALQDDLADPAAEIAKLREDLAEAVGALEYIASGASDSADADAKRTLARIKGE